MYPGQIIKGTGFRLRKFDDSEDDSELFPSLLFSETTEIYAELMHESVAQDTIITIEFTPRDVTRWKMAWREMQKNQKSYWDSSYYGMQRFFVKRSKDRPDTEDMLRLPIALAFSATALIYGGLHAMAWHAYFKSATEQLLWRISACVVMGGIPLHLLIAKFYISTTWKHAYTTKKRYRVLDFIIYQSPLGLLFSAYVLARAYLVVECFISLAHLPAEVYDVPSWASYFPHIS